MPHRMSGSCPLQELQLSQVRSHQRLLVSTKRYQNSPHFSIDRVSRLLVLVCAVLSAFLVRVADADPAEARKIFTQRCMACHTYGKGVKVGPDLKGVTERRERAWLQKFIRSSQTVIASGDATAVALFQQFKQQQMPDWTDLSKEQIDSILDWLAVGGPEQREGDDRSADSATAAEIETGRQLFHGRRAFKSGGVSCASCHRVEDSGSPILSASFSFDLTNIYAEHHDGGFTQYMKRPCLVRFPESQMARFLTPDESFALKAYLRHTALPASIARAKSRVTNPAVGEVGKSATNDAAAGAAATPAAKPQVIWAPRHRAAGSRDGVPTGAPSSGVLFRSLPYVALLILLVGLGVRYVVARRRPEEQRPAAAAAWQRFGGTVRWRVGMAFTFLAHVLGLLLPSFIVTMGGAPVRLYLIEATGLIFGVVALLGWGQITWQHLGRNPAATRLRISEVADTVFLAVCGAALLSGLAMALSYRWGALWSSGTLTPYIVSLGRGVPIPELVEQMPLVIRLHVLSWFVLMAVVPFTSVASLIVYVMTRGIDRIAGLLAGPMAAVSRVSSGVKAKLNPSRWLWPDEDLEPPAVKQDDKQDPR
jgi:nitrate reductase gamma subunit